MAISFIITPSLCYDQSIVFLDLSDGSDDSKLGLRDGINENDEAVQERLKLKRKLECNTTSFTQEQIDVLEQGNKKDVFF
jgi:hypothetical protein